MLGELAFEYSMVFYKNNGEFPGKSLPWQLKKQITDIMHYIYISIFGIIHVSQDIFFLSIKEWPQLKSSIVYWG